MTTAEHAAPAFEDLLSLPFRCGADGPEAYDCWGVVTAILARLGLCAPELSDTIREVEMQSSDPASVFEYGSRAATLVGCEPWAASKIGDILVCARSANGPAHHVAVLVRTRPQRLVLHCLRGAGVIASAPESLGCVVAVYRPKRAAS